MGNQEVHILKNKKKAMELILTGEFMNADEAFKRGMVSRVVPSDKTICEALSLAKKIASLSKPMGNLKFINFLK